MIKKETKREIAIQFLLATRGRLTTKMILDHLHDAAVSDVTLRRDLGALVRKQRIQRFGAGPSTEYEITVRGRLTLPVDAAAYCQQAPDTRNGSTGFDHTLFDGIQSPIFSQEIVKRLNAATKNYLVQRQRDETVSAKKELERFVIELAWKSSKIEGNTYNLLDTEKLITRGELAKGHDKVEATMILNHKKAFEYIYQHKEKVKKITPKVIMDIHRLLTEGLDVGTGIRKKLVGITGTSYKPLGNQFQIAEALAALCKAVNGLKNGYEKALVTLAGIAYIQAFEDGNKRTSRLMANAVLLAYDLAPLSYRSVSEDVYRDAVIVFYELRSLQPLIDVFVEQYLFSANHYSI